MSGDIEIKFDNFEDIKVSTKTYVVSTNITVDLKKLFEIMEITPYEVKKKKRGRRRKGDVEENYDKDLKEGSVITSKWEGNIRGCQLKQPVKNSNGESTYFRNSVTIVIFFDKFINCKICKSGTLHLTGCKSWTHPEKCVKKIWNMIKNTDIYTFKNNDTKLKSFIIPCMRNIDFELGFLVDREKLSKYAKKTLNTHCLLEGSLGYTGVSVKFPISIEDRLKMQVKTMEYSVEGKWEHNLTTFENFLNTLSDKERRQKIKDKRYNTFLIFHSGKVIFSGPDSYMMKDTYTDFCKMIKTGFKEIVEVLDK